MKANFSDKMRIRRPYSELYGGKIKECIDDLLGAMGISLDNGRTLKVIDNYMDDATTYDAAFKFGLDNGEVIVARLSTGEEKEILIQGNHADLKFNAVFRFVYVGKLSEISDDGKKGDEETVKLAYYNISLTKDNLGYKIKHKVSKNEQAELTTSAYDNSEGRFVRKERYHVAIYNFKEVLDEVSDFVGDPCGKHNRLRNDSTQGVQKKKGMRNTQSGKNSF